ncbi:hypothetical protein HL667_06200 [Bradyrhizobium sp. 83012]|uniref:Uncharacterized protein n=1 Tax=Bradyrhizobium aeschynomenes TaxID=2734909 RepID=A0ABX2CBG2_9BRAD|nr:hypothetical protein [Bradyrhizobium aeschynomenes]NPU64584.1 hypothetical protein [Bradyrhizobium aeschynomenes]
MNDPESMVERVKHGARETTTHLITVDDLIVYRADGDGMVIEFVRWSRDRKPVEGYRITLCPEDAARIRKA